MVFRRYSGSLQSYSAIYNRLCSDSAVRAAALVLSNRLNKPLCAERTDRILIGCCCLGENGDLTFFPSFSWPADLMVRFSITSGKFSSSAFSSSKVMAPLPSLSADSKSASVRSSSFSSGREMALSRRHDLRTVRSSSGSMEPLPAQEHETRCLVLACVTSRD